jgi:hypothetical protein
MSRVALDHRAASAITLQPRLDRLQRRLEHIDEIVKGGPPMSPKTQIESKVVGDVPE